MSWEKKVKKTVPYTAGEQPKEKNIIKLNTNECPYPPAPGVRKAMEELLVRTDDLRLYPDMNASELTDALSAFYGIDSSRIFVGVGSDDVLALCFLTFFTGGDPILFPAITYSFYPVWADLYGIPYQPIPLTEELNIDPYEYMPRLTGIKNGGIIFPNPNAPTGVEMPMDQVERIIAANPDCVVIVDEAYVDFGGTSALPLLEKYDNLLVVQTFSKSRAMAGQRVGFAIGNKKIIDYLKDVKFSFNSYTMNLPAIELGTEAVTDAAYFHEITGRIVNTRERFKKELRDLGFTFPDSKTNFVFAKPPKMSAKDLFMALRERKIFVRYFNKPRISEYLRITIGTDEQMDAVTAALKEILSGELS
jgi:histidinol-phosphate aminotransferase